MPALDFSNGLVAILPEMILVVAGVIAFLWGAADETKAGPIGTFSVLALLVALLSLTTAAGVGNGPFLGGAFLGDGLSVFVRGVFYAATLLLALSGAQYVQRYQMPAGEYYGLLLLASAGGGLMASAGNLLTFYVGLEMLSFSSYILVGMRESALESQEASLKYFLNGAIASAAMLFGFSWLYGLTGTLDITLMAEQFAAGSAPSVLLALTMAFVIAGFGFKLATVPFHLWAPDVYQGAPTPVTGFLSVVSKGAALAAALRLFYLGLGPIDGHWTTYWALLAAITMTWGNVSALHQTNIKRMLGYSSIAQAGYLLVSLAVGSQLGMTAGVFFLLTYAFTNIGAFAVITAIGASGGSDEIADYAGLAKRNPFLAGALAIFMLSLIGVPFTAGFFGKLQLISAAVDKQLIWLALFVALNSVVSVGYYYGVVRNMYLRPDEGKTPAAKPSLAANLAVVVALVGTLGAGIVPQFLQWAQTAIASMPF